MKLRHDIKKRLKRNLGRRTGRKTHITISFDLFTPYKGYFNPADDEALILDLLDQIQQQMIRFHDVPGFKLSSVKINGEEIL